MTTPVVTATPESSFREIVDLLITHDIGAVPVIDDDGWLVGLISEADLISKQAYGGRRRRVFDGFSGLARRETRELTRSRGRTAREIMSAPVDTALVDEPLRAVARRMVENQLRHLVVVDDDRRMVGIVSRHDLLRAFDRPDAEIVEGVVDVLETSRRRGHVSVTSDRGIVTIEGQPARTEDVDAGCRLAWMVPGVVDVVYRATADAGASTGTDDREGA